MNCSVDVCILECEGKNLMIVSELFYFLLILGEELNKLFYWVEVVK